MKNIVFFMTSRLKYAIRDIVPIKQSMLFVAFMRAYFIPIWSIIRHEEFSCGKTTI
jgi:hypothetical protein